jgi:hypothetical protein
MQLTAAAMGRRLAAFASVLSAALIVLGTGSAARAEQLPQNPAGEVQVRGNYWRDRNTRVWNPTVDVVREVAGGVSVGAHYMVDAITSASIAAGATSDEPFTEVRHEAGFSLDVPVSRIARVSGSYQYSSESDYWSHIAGLRLKLNLFQDSTGLLVGADYSNNVAAKRLGPTGYLLQGRLQSVHLVALATQVLNRTALTTLSYEVTISKGFHNNPYRPVFVGNERREWENLPTSRVRHMLASSWHLMLRTGGLLTPHVTLRPALRLYFDSWGLLTLIPELATHVPVGPVELRLLLSYYGQPRAASFYRAEGGDRRGYVQDTPSYAGGPVEFDGEQVYTSDVKLGAYSSGTFELQLKWRLSVLSGLPHIGEFLGQTAVELTGGMWLADRAVGWQYGIPLVGGDPQAPAGCSLRCGAFYANLGFYIPL